jgi:hypothetical protein
MYIVLTLKKKVEKKPVPLKEAIYNKLKSRNLEIDKCIAFIKDSK